MAKMQILSAYFNAFNPILCTSNKEVHRNLIVDEWDGHRMKAFHWEVLNFYTLGCGYDVARSHVNHAQCGVSDGGKCWLLATNDCSHTKWERTLKTLTRVFGKALHESCHCTSGCGGTTRYLWVNSDEVEII